MKITCEVKKIKRSFCVVAGVSILAKYRTEAEAVKALEEKASFFAYWAGSGGVSYENREKKIIYV